MLRRRNIGRKSLARKRRKIENFTVHVYLARLRVANTGFKGIGVEIRIKMSVRKNSNAKKVVKIIKKKLRDVTES